MIIGIKLGSATLVDTEGRINEEFILSVCQQIAFLLRKGHDLFLVSSGAITSAPYPEFSDSLRSVIGQSSLISKYKKFFNVFGIKVGQLLLTDYDFKKNSITIKWNLWEAFYYKIVLIINANDGVWNKEIKALQQCSDNDILFYNICNLICPDLAIIGITEQGLLDFQGRIVSIVKVNKEIPKVLKYANGGNKFGHGCNGMQTKILVCSKLAKNKIRTILVPTREQDFIIRAIKKEKIGTIFSS